MIGGFYERNYSQGGDKVQSMMRGAVFICLFMSLSSLAKTIELDIDELLVPNFTQAQIVSDGMSFNGMDVIIIQFRTKRSFEDIEQYYRDNVDEIKVSMAGQWKVISWLAHKKLNTVQVTFDPLLKVHHGYIALSNLPVALENKVQLGNGFPALQKSTFQNDIKAVDLNKESRTIWLTNKASVFDNINFYKNHYKKQGWKVQQETFNRQKTSAALLLSKQGNEINLTANRINKLTNIVAVEVII